MIYIVTGVSRGIGKAVAELYLHKGQKVIGVGRTNVIEHDNYSFIPCDLSNEEEVNKLFIDEIFNDAVTLINNAGVIGDIRRVSQQESLDLGLVLQVNTVAPMVLAKTVYENMSNKNEFTLVNISSGAANRAIPSWAAYCASKAALNMTTECFALEERELGFYPKIYAVAPGVIDTAMQDKIRSAKEENFSSVKNFISLKEDKNLFTPEETAKRLDKLLNQEYSDEVFFDLRSIDL